MQGVQGSAGGTGAKGTRGPVGQTGPRGPPGVSVSLNFLPRSCFTTHSPSELL